MFDSSLTAYLMINNLAADLQKHAVTLYEVGKLENERLSMLVKELDTIEASSQGIDGEASKYYNHAINLRETIKFLRSCSVHGSDGLDLIRAERLGSIPPNARAKILCRNYSLIVSTAPLNCEKVSITSSLPPHFGPVIPECNSPWFKLYIYNLIGCGVNSILYPKGYRAKLLPNLFRVLLFIYVNIRTVRCYT